MMFDNLEITFSQKSNKELKLSYYLFKLMGFSKLIHYFAPLMNWCAQFPNPIRWMMKNTLFQQFVGGETIHEAEFTMNQLQKSHVGTILDYSVEGKQSVEDFIATKNELLAMIEATKDHPSVPMFVFKVTGVVRFELLEKKQSKVVFSQEEDLEYQTSIQLVEEICEAAIKAHKPIMIDAEESWIQEPIDVLAEQLMQKYNKEHCFIYNTLQLYKINSESYLYKWHPRVNGSYKIGVKLVRGAYMEKERERALKEGYPSPIHKNKQDTDEAFNRALNFCIQHLDTISVVMGSHNEWSNQLAVEGLKAQNHSENDSRFYFVQLLGMSDNISFNLAQKGYQVAKYVPYGPIKEVMPYLLRRAQENTSIEGQVGRELKLIQEELKRRKLQ